MPNNQKIDLTYDRMLLALILGGLSGFFIAYYLEYNYVFWITLCTAVAFGIETITRVSGETKKAHPPAKPMMPTKGMPAPKIRQPKLPKFPKKLY